MRKLIIIGLLLLLAAWLLLMPMVVGFYMRDTIPTWLAEWSEPNEADYRPGWFGSRLEWRPDAELSLRLDARHFPPLKPGWLALQGDLDSPLTPRGADVRGHIGLTGSWHLSATVERFEPLLHNDLIAHQLWVNVSQVAGQPLSLIVNADRIDLPAQAPPLLDLRARGLRRENENDQISLGLDLQAQTHELGPTALTLRAGPMDAAQLELLIQGLGQLAESSPGSVTESMALLTLAGAWQQMATDGLIIELERLELGTEIRFQGRWRAGQTTPMATGAGDLDELERWLRRFAPQANFGDLMDALAEAGELEIRDRRFQLSVSPDPGPSSATPHPRPAP
ncbi:MAG: hypothetical protein V2J42_13390 [Wenzhouxiangella sp.]|jgi:hypothetical protein|nr:hypothetical protein [Wenzhouxiangella sp.]